MKEAIESSGEYGGEGKAHVQVMDVIVLNLNNFDDYRKKLLSIEQQQTKLEINYTFVDSSSTIVKADTSFEVVVEEARNESFNIEPELYFYRKL